MSHRWMRAAVMVVVAAGGLAGMAKLSALRIAFRRSSDARVRLSWSARPERIEVCRALSTEEQAQREAHMRQRVECTGRFATYDLRVEVDGRPVEASLVQGGGLRHDRPLYLLRELTVPSGTHRVRVSLVRRERADSGAAAPPVPTIAADADTGLYAGRTEREAAERTRRARAAIPPSLALDTTLVLAPRSVILVTLNPERRQLEWETGPAPPK